MTTAAPGTPPQTWPPASLGIELTTCCNSSCRHCFARAGLAREASLTFEDARAICAEGYQRGYRHLHLTGGEPLLWDGLLELLADAFAMGFESIFLNSNGMRLTPETARHLARFPDLALSISYQADPGRHDRLRGAGTSRQTVRGLRAGLEAGLAVTVFTVVGRSLLKDLAVLAAGLFSDFPGIKRLTLIRMFVVREVFTDLAPELLDPEDFLSMVRTVAGLNLFGFRTDVLNDPLANVAADLLGMPWIPASQPLCRPGRLMIRANRDITLAHSTREAFGRFRSGALDRVRSSRRYRQAVAADDRICPACRFVSRCRAHGLLRPASTEDTRQPARPFCQRVLATAVGD
jgi:MoaA/NifB/PqqE/SkfB family radical SAM enzyme